MPRTRKSIVDVPELTAHQNLPSSPKSTSKGKKRTVSDRSPAIKSRKKTQESVTPKTKRAPEDKENRTPGPTPYWLVSFSLFFLCSHCFFAHISFPLFQSLGCRGAWSESSANKICQET